MIHLNPSILLLDLSDFKKIMTEKLLDKTNLFTQSVVSTSVDEDILIRKIQEYLSN